MLWHAQSGIFSGGMCVAIAMSCALQTSWSDITWCTKCKSPKAGLLRLDATFLQTAPAMTRSRACAGMFTTCVTLLPFFQTARFRPFRAGLFAGLGLWGIFPAAHALWLHGAAPAVRRFFGLDMLMGAVYLVRHAMPGSMCSACPACTCRHMHAVRSYNMQLSMSCAHAWPAFACRAHASCCMLSHGQSSAGGCHGTWQHI